LYPSAQFLAFSYLGSDPATGHPFPYTCLDTFTQHLAFYALLLGNQLTSYLQTQPPNTITEVYLIGHSMGGTVALAYLTALLEAPTQVTPLPANGNLAGVITLDSPLGGVSSDTAYQDLAWKSFNSPSPLPFHISPSHCQGLTDRTTQFVSETQLAQLFDT